VKIIDLNNGKLLAGPYCGKMNKSILGGVGTGQIRIEFFTQIEFEKTTGFSVNLKGVEESNTTLNVLYDKILLKSDFPMFYHS